MPGKPARQLQRLLNNFHAKPAGVKAIYAVLLLCLVGAFVRVLVVPGKYVRPTWFGAPVPYAVMPAAKALMIPKFLEGYSGRACVWP